MDLATNCKSGKELQRELERTSFPKSEKLARFCGDLVDKLRPPKVPKRPPLAAEASEAESAAKRAKTEPAPKEEPRENLSKEELRERDKRERDELNERIKQREQERTKKVASGTLASEGESKKR